MASLQTYLFKCVHIKIEDEEEKKKIENVIEFFFIAQPSIKITYQRDEKHDEEPHRTHRCTEMRIELH